MSTRALPTHAQRPLRTGWIVAASAAAALTLLAACEREGPPPQNPQNQAQGQCPAGYQCPPGYGQQPPACPPGYQCPPGYGQQPGYNPQQNPQQPGYNPQQNPQQPGYNPQQYPGYNPQQYPGYNPQQYPGYNPQQNPQPYPTGTQTAPPQPTVTASTPGGWPPSFPFPFPTMTGAPTGTQSAPPAPSGSQQPSTGAATPIDPNFAQAATVPLALFATQQASGMTKDGPLVAGNFQVGQTMEQAFQMLPNKCYTVLAVGAGITEVDISIVAVTPLPQASGVLAQDTGTGNQAALGGGGNCYKWVWPVGINAKYVVKATKGQGVAAAQLYSK